MAQLDTIREKLDIKILLLFILRRLPDAVPINTVAELVSVSAGVGYFDFAECLSELADAGHVERELDSCRITEKGDRNGEIAESSLPFSVRSRIEALLEPIADDMRRRAQITACHTEDESGCRVMLSLGDGFGQILELKLLCSGEEQAKRIEESFAARAESTYNRIIELLDPATAAQAEKSRQTAEEDAPAD